MERRFFEYSHNHKNGKYTEITEEEYLKAKATGNRFFMCLDGVFLECEKEELVSYYSEKDHSDYTQKNANGHHVKPLSYDLLSHNSNFESIIMSDPTKPTMEQKVEEQLFLEWELKSLHKALEKLKPYERTLIHRIYWDGVTQSELAREYHISQQTMNEKVNRILCKLLKLMKSKK